MEVTVGYVSLGYNTGNIQSMHRDNIIRDRSITINNYY